MPSWPTRPRWYSSTSAALEPFIVTSLPISASLVTGAGGQIYAMAGLQLQVVNVGLPLASPSVLGISDSFSSQGMASYGSTVLLASPQTDASKGTGGLYFVDASVPETPNLVTNLYDGFDNWGWPSQGRWPWSPATRSACA